MNKKFSNFGYHFSSYGEERAPILILHHADDQEDYSSYENYFADHHILFIEIRGNRWERDFSPVPAPKVFHGGKDFPGGASDYLTRFVSKVVPYLIKHCSITPDRIVLSGYSLAGLFALYASQNALFTDILSASGSLWFPEYIDYLRIQKVYARNIYLSIGDRESRSKSKILQTAFKKQREAYKILSSRNKNVTFFLEKGGHFDAPEKRVMRGVEWLVAQK